MERAACCMNGMACRIRVRLRGPHAQGKTATEYPCVLVQHPRLKMTSSHANFGADANHIHHRNMTNTSLFQYLTIRPCSTRGTSSIHLRSRLATCQTKSEDEVDGDIVDGRGCHDIPMFDDAECLGSVDLVDVAIGFICSDRLDVYCEVFGIDNETGNLGRKWPRQIRQV